LILPGTDGFDYAQVSVHLPEHSEASVTCTNDAAVAMHRLYGRVRRAWSLPSDTGVVAQVGHCVDAHIATTSRQRRPRWVV